MESMSDDWDQNKPGRPFQVGEPSVDTITIKWEPPPQIPTNLPIMYDLRYKNVTAGISSRWTPYKELLADTFLKLENLPAGNKFIFKVRIVDDDVEGPFSEQSDEIETIKSVALKNLPILVDVDNKNGKMSKKYIKFEEDTKCRNTKAQTRKMECEYGIKSNVSSTEKTIMIVGPTGAGKSTLVDGMINYIFGVSWKDPFRLTVENLEPEEKKYAGNEAQSQTVWITCYTIRQMEGARIKYKLTIVDTPGYGHVKGIEYDIKITDQIRSLFTAKDSKGLRFLDAVCFVIKAPDARLTKSQEYVFRAISSLFGKDIIENFCMMTTFADGQPPKALAALKAANLPDDPYFTFNNSVLFSDNTALDSSDLDRSILDWNMGKKAFDQFFARLEMLKSKSLSLSKEVLEKRRNLEITVGNMRTKLAAALEMIKSFDEEIELLQKSHEEIEKNKNFNYTCKETKISKTSSENFNMNCISCKTTCHKKCWAFNFDLIVRFCEAFEGGHCTQCDSKCTASYHKNEKEEFIYVTREVHKTYEDVLQKYEEATKKRLNHQELLAEMKVDMKKLDTEIEHMIGDIVYCNQRLKEIALCDDPLSVAEHFDIWILEEKIIRSYGWEDRVKSLLKYKNQAEMLANIETDVKSVQHKIHDKCITFDQLSR